MALYFASTGVGTLHDGHGTSSSRYISPARVLLSGLGSDELLGGYSRHRVAFKTNSWDGLNDEVSPINMEHGHRRFSFVEIVLPMSTAPA